jgi:hypothetical protein
MAFALSTRDLLNVLKILSEANMSSSTLESVAASLRTYFAKPDYFRVGNALTMLLQHKDLLPLPSQRIAAMFLLYELYRSDQPSANPFAQFFVELLQPQVVDDRVVAGMECGHALSPVEKWFLAHLLTSQTPKDLFRKTAAAIASTDTSSLQLPDLPSLVAALSDPHDDITSHTKTGLSSVIADPDPTATSRFSVPEAGQAAESFLCRDEMAEQTFEPGLLRPRPPLYHSEEETIWLNPFQTQCPIQWDTLMCSHSAAEAMRLFYKACGEVLSLPEQQALSGQFKNDPKLVYQVGLTPKKLPDLVEKNPTVAIEALLCLTNSSQLSAYFAALLNMDMSLHSMEVVNRLTSAVDLPPEFLHLYINNCIQRCRKISDKSLQSRLVRLVCVFLQSLIRNGTIDVQNDLEIQAFALEHSRIKEATALYRLLKTLEGGGAEAAGTK